MSIKAIFYCRFDPLEGPKVIHQVPENSIVPSADRNDGSALFSFPSISPFVIPHQSLCGSFISLVPPPLQPTHGGAEWPAQSYRILGYPICRSSPSYRRNEFIFNFCLVLSAADPDFNAYKSVVTKLAHLMLALEEQSNFLSRDTAPLDTGKIYSLCETLISDLNNYCECMIPIDDLNTLNLKLFPTYAAPPPVKAWQVPIFTVRPESLMDENWDLTMQRIVPHINGIRSVKHIAILADADLRLTKQCMKHLLYYGCLLLLDIFSFNAIYAHTAEFSTTIAADEEMQRECARYCNLAFAPTAAANRLDQSVFLPDVSGMNDDIWPLDSAGKPVDGVGIVELFAALRQGLSVREWYTEKSDMLVSIDLRRFITFGVIKGFVYRVHKYAYAVNQNATVRTRQAAPAVGQDGARSIPARANSRHQSHPAQGTEQYESEDDAATITSRTNRRHHNQAHQQGRTISSSSTTDNDVNADSGIRNQKPNPKSGPNTRKRREQQPDSLSRYLDGTHTFDQICTELEISEAELESMLKRRQDSSVHLSHHHHHHRRHQRHQRHQRHWMTTQSSYLTAGSSAGAGGGGSHGLHAVGDGNGSSAGAGTGVGGGGELLIIHR